MNADAAFPSSALRTLLVKVLASNRFYRAKLADLAHAQANLNLNWETFRTRIPFTTKQELVEDQHQHPPYGSNLTYPIPQYTRCHQTSGTSGAPLRWLDTAESWSGMIDDWGLVLQSAGVRAGDRILFAFSFGPFLGFWLGFEAAQRIGCLCFPGGGMSSALRARLIWENKCKVLCCTPTYALHLSEVAREEHLPLFNSPVEKLILAGEPGASLPATRQRLKEAWPGAEPYDHHGMTEVGPVTCPDPDHPGRLVIIDRSYIAEVVDPTSGAPVNFGVEGELVLTTLRRTGSPLIRYRTGDLVRAVRAGSKIGLEGGILGRIDDMVIVRGINIYPNAIEQWVRSIAGAAEYRVTLDQRATLPELEIELEASPEIAGALERTLKAQLALRIPVQPVPEGTLPRFELKARRWVRKLESSPAHASP